MTDFRKNYQENNIRNIHLIAHGLHNPLKRGIEGGFIIDRIPHSTFDVGRSMFDVQIIAYEISNTGNNFKMQLPKYRK